MLQKTRVAVLVERDYEDSEFVETVRAMNDAGVKVVVVGSGSQKSYRGKRGRSRASSSHQRNPDELGSLLPSRLGLQGVGRLGGLHRCQQIRELGPSSRDLKYRAPNQISAELLTTRGVEADHDSDDQKNHARTEEEAVEREGLGEHST